jgi:hypothetical protein
MSNTAGGALDNLLPRIVALNSPQARRLNHELELELDGEGYFDQEAVAVEPDAEPRATGVPILSESTFGETRGPTDAIRTCIVHSAYDSTGTVTFDGESVHNTISIKRNQEGFTTDNGQSDYDGKIWVKFNLVRTEEMGWVPRDCLTFGKPATDIRMIVVGDELAGPDQVSNVKEQGTLLERTISSLYSAIRRDKDELLREGAMLEGLNDITVNGNRHRRDILNSKSRTSNRLVNTNEAMR